MFGLSDVKEEGKLDEELAQDRFKSVVEFLAHIQSSLMLRITNARAEIAKISI